MDAMGIPGAERDRERAGGEGGGGAGGETQQLDTPAAAERQHVAIVAVLEASGERAAPQFY